MQIGPKHVTDPELTGRAAVLRQISIRYVHLL